MAVSCKPYLHAVAKARDQKAEILSWVGNLSGLRPRADRVLVATYARPEKIGNIIMPESMQAEDEYQGCVGLVLALGPDAFIYDGQYYSIQRRQGESDDEWNARFAAYMESQPRVGDWVLYQPSHGHGIALRQVACRILKSESIEMRVDNPAAYY